MKKYVKLTLCGLAAVMLAAGCAKKTEEPDTSASVETTQGAAEDAVIDKGDISNLGTYKGVEVTKMSTEVTDEALKVRIQSILTANPEYIEITDRPAQNGDVLNIDFVGMKDGVAFDGGTSEGYELELGSKSFIDGFEEGLIGAKTGDELSLNLTFPKEYHNADLAGQAVVFDVTVNRIEIVKDAVLDNNFVQRMSDFNTVDEWQADLLADMEAELETQADRQMEYDAFLAAVENSEYKLNEAAVDEQYNLQMDYITSMLQATGMSFSDYASYNGMTEDQFKEDLRQSSELAVQQELLAKAIAENEGLKVETADLETLAAQYNMTVEELKSTYGEDRVEETAMMFKVSAFIKDNAVVK